MIKKIIMAIGLVLIPALGFTQQVIEANAGNLDAENLLPEDQPVLIDDTNQPELPNDPINVNYEYQSNYQLISWATRNNDVDYCLDITDENWNIYPGFQALQCGQDFHEFSPDYYVRDIMHTSLPDGFKFNWRIWSPSGYGGEGFEGQVVVQN